MTEEIERTYLAKYLPADLKDYPVAEIRDFYFPEHSDHPKIRLRQKGGVYVLTKKDKLDANDASRLSEQTIQLTEEEALEFLKLPSKKVHKLRYDYQPAKAEIDVFQDDLAGLVLIDFEFNSLTERDAFQSPAFCLVEVTQEKLLAGGRLTDKSLFDLEPILTKFNYQKI